MKKKIGEFPPSLTACVIAVMLPALLCQAADTHLPVTDWMGAVTPTTPLSQLLIPGTHNSGARFEPLRGTAACQTLSITEQLNAGVRFLDIRCRHRKDSFAIFHGSINQLQRFDDVLTNVVGFLDAHPTECVVMSIQEVRGAQNNTRPFEKTFDAYVARNPKQWHLKPTIPTIAEARGKIILLRRFRTAAPPKGISGHPWRNSPSLRIQDNARVHDNNAKWQRIENLFKASAQAPSSTLFINFCSGCQRGPFGIPNIRKVSNQINPRLETYLAGHPPRLRGIVAMDFITAKSAALILNQNNHLQGDLGNVVEAKGSAGT